MDPFLLISGALALLGGGAGAYAWYQKTYNPTAAQTRDAAIAASGNAYTGPVVAATYATPAAAHDAQVAARVATGSATAYTGPVVLATKPAVPATPSPYIAPGPTSVVTTPAPTKGPTVSISLPLGLGTISGTEAHI